MRGSLHSRRLTPRPKSCLWHDLALMPIIAALMLNLFFSPIAGAEKKTVIWVNENFPPAFITSGPDKGNGITDGAVSLYKQHLPQYRHQHLVANMARILALMKEGKNVCYAGFIKTPEREKYIRFSLPNIITYSNGLIVKTSRQEALFSSLKSVSLAQLLMADQLKVGLTKGRAYGKPIDTLLKTHAAKSRNIFFRGGQDELLGLLKMLDQERIDFTIGYPWEIAYLASQQNRRDHYRVMPIQETAGHQWVISYAGCPDTEWGRSFIRDLNQALLKVRETETYMYHMLKWYPPELEADYRHAFEAQILSVTE